MRITGRAVYRDEVIGKGYHRVIGWELVSQPWVDLASGMVRQAKKEGKRKLPWFWKKAKALGWDDDETAWWVLTGLWHRIPMGSDLKQVF